MSKTAVVTGAGTGVGRATVLFLANKGWKVALVGRREAALKETVLLAAERGKDCLIFPGDVSQPEEVSDSCQRILAAFGHVDVLVNAAGTNTPKRSLLELPLEKYREIVETNLTGSYLFTQGLLPHMRERQSGTIVNVVSDAAKQASPKAGPAYVVSKFGLLGLTQAINAEERGRGIRACAILPGDINTPLLEKRPQVPASEARLRMLQPEDVVECIWLAINLPPRAVVEELLVRPA